ncbi:MAG: hypothetical protein ACTHWA_00500 [Arachnia sp.]
MESATSGLPLATTAINTVLLLLAAVAAVGSALPLWPPLSLKYMGRPSPIENFILMVFDYPTGAAWMWSNDLSLGVWVLVMAPVVVQTLLIIALALLLVRLLSEISCGRGFQMRARRTLTAFSVVGIGGGLVQLTVGIVAWQVGRGLWDPNPGLFDGGYQAALINAFPFPQWPLTLILIGIVAIVLGVAFRDGAKFEQEFNGVF